MSDFPNCVWVGPVFEPTGYADEGRGLLVALERLGVPVALRAKAALDPKFGAHLPVAMREVLDRQRARPVGSPYVIVQHYVADGFVPAPQAAYVVGRTMFESDSLPPRWVARCNEMDELWVPSEFNRETFRRAGVRVPMHLVPGGIDSDVYRPDVQPLPVEGLRGTVFLSVFEWRVRKGWDVLLRAWAEAFTASDDVTLLLRTHAKRIHATDDPTRAINERIDAFLAESCGRTRAEVAPIVILGDDLPADAMPSLYTTADVVVAPTRGEGWGRPFMEAMASGVPVIATRWSAHLEFMNDDNSFLIDNEGLVDASDPDALVYDGQRWARPSESDLVAKLRLAHVDPDRRRATGARARRDMVELWPWSRAAEAMADRLRAIESFVAGSGTQAKQQALVSVSSHAALHETISIEADVFRTESSTIGVEQLLTAVVDELGVTVSVRPRSSDGVRPSHGLPTSRLWARRASAPSTAREVSDVTLTCLSRTAETAPTAPISGAWIVYTGDRVRQRVPESLALVLRDADAVWVPHRTAYDACVTIGVDASRLWTLPFGSIADVEAPEAARFARPRGVSTLLLLPVLDESDIAPADLVLRVWQRQVTAESDVRLQLLVPSDATETLAAWAQAMQQRMRTAKLAPGLTAEVLIAECTDDLLPSRIRSADVVVSPGAIAMSVWQIALACGRPLIVPASPDAHELLHGEPAWIVKCGANGMMSGLELGNALREACNGELQHARAVAARNYSESMPTWKTVAQSVVTQIEQVCATNSVSAAARAS